MFWLYTLGRLPATASRQVRHSAIRCMRPFRLFINSCMFSGRMPLLSVAHTGMLRFRASLLRKSNLLLFLISKHLRYSMCKELWPKRLKKMHIDRNKPRPYGFLIFARKSVLRLPCQCVQGNTLYMNILKTFLKGSLEDCICTSRCPEFHRVWSASILYIHQIYVCNAYTCNSAIPFPFFESVFNC